MQRAPSPSRLLALFGACGPARFRHGDLRDQSRAHRWQVSGARGESAAEHTADAVAGRKADGADCKRSGGPASERAQVNVPVVLWWEHEIWLQTELLTIPIYGEKTEIEQFRDRWDEPSREYLMLAERGSGFWFHPVAGWAELVLAEHSWHA